MKRKITSAAAGALLLLTLAAAACGETQAGEPPWEPVPLPVGGGHIYIAYDSQRDMLWLLNWSFRDALGRFNDGATTLVRLEPTSRDYQSYVIRGPIDGLGLDAGLAVDGQGAVWAAWGHRLIRLDPANGETEEWAVPRPDAAALAGYDTTTRGMAVEVTPAPDGRVWVALESATVVMALDPATGAWSNVDTAPLMAIGRSRLSFTRDGRLLLNGVIRGHPDLGNVPGGGSAMVSIDPVADEATLTGVAAFAYAVRADGTVDYVDADTGAVRTLTPDGADLGTGAELAVDSLYPIRQVMAGDGADGLWFWLWQSGEPTLDVIRLGADTGETSPYPYPLIISAWDGTGPGPFLPLGANPADFIGRQLAASPQIQGLAVDRRGDVWVAAGSSLYPPLYRLHVD